MPDRAAADGERTDTDNGELCGDHGEAKRLLRVLRKHWDIEKTFDAPQVMAAFRNLTSTLVRWAGHTNVAAALRAHVSEAFALIGIHPYLTQE